MNSLINLIKLLVAIGIGVALCIGHGVTFADEPTDVAEPCFTKEQLFLQEQICSEIADGVVEPGRGRSKLYRYGMLCRIAAEEGVIYIFECDEWKDGMTCLKPVNRVCSLKTPLQE